MVDETIFYKENIINWEYDNLVVRFSIQPSPDKFPDKQSIENFYCEYSYADGEWEEMPGTGYVIAAPTEPNTELGVLEEIVTATKLR